MASLNKALPLRVVCGSYNPLNIVELRKRSSNINILPVTIYRKLSKYSQLADNVFIEEYYYTPYILILKGLSFYLSRYILLSNS